MAAPIACGGANAGTRTTPTAAATTTSANDPPSPNGDAPLRDPRTVCSALKDLPSVSSRAATSLDAIAWSDSGESAKDADRSSSSARSAKDATYSMDDLQALKNKKSWRELLSHLQDIPPAKRDARWDAWLEEAATGYLDAVGAGASSYAGFRTAMSLVTEYPQLTSSRGFMQKRLDVSKIAYADCLTGSYDGDECLKSMTDFLKVGTPNADVAFTFGKMVRPKLNAYAAVPFFRQGLQGRSSNDAACGDEDVKLAVIAGLGLPVDYDNARGARQIAAGTCWSRLEPAIRNEFKTESPTGYYVRNACGVLKAKGAF